MLNYIVAENQLSTLGAVYVNYQIRKLIRLLHKILKVLKQG